jgi:hypothetical protein
VAVPRGHWSAAPPVQRVRNSSLPHPMGRLPRRQRLLDFEESLPADGASRNPSPTKQHGEAAGVAPAAANKQQHGDVVGRYLRRISRRLRKARRVPAADQVSAHRSAARWRRGRRGTLRMRRRRAGRGAMVEARPRCTLDEERRGRSRRGRGHRRRGDC